MGGASEIGGARKTEAGRGRGGGGGEGEAEGGGNCDSAWLEMVVRGWVGDYKVWGECGASGGCEDFAGGVGHDGGNLWHVCCHCLLKWRPIAGRTRASNCNVTVTSHVPRLYKAGLMAHCRYSLLYPTLTSLYTAVIC